MGRLAVLAVVTMALAVAAAAAVRGQVPTQQEICESFATCKECSKYDIYGCVWCGVRARLTTAGNCTYMSDVTQSVQVHCERQRVTFEGQLPDDYEYSPTCFERDLPPLQAPCRRDTCPVGFRCTQFAPGFICTVDPEYQPCSPDPCGENEVCLQTHAAGKVCQPVNPCNPSGQGNPCPPRKPNGSQDTHKTLCLQKPNGYECVLPDVCQIAGLCAANEACVPNFGRDPPFFCDAGGACDSSPCPDGHVCDEVTNAAGVKTARCTDPLAQHKALEQCLPLNCGNCTRRNDCIWCNADGNPLGHDCYPAFHGCPDGTGYNENKKCPAVDPPDAKVMCAALECDQCRAYPKYCMWCNSGGDRRCQARDVTRCPGGAPDETRVCDYDCGTLTCAPGGTCAGNGLCRCGHGTVFKKDVGCVPGSALGIGGIAGLVLGLLVCIAVGVFVAVCVVRRRGGGGGGGKSDGKSKRGGGGGDAAAAAGGGVDMYGNATDMGAYGDPNGLTYGNAAYDPNGGSYDAQGNYYAADGTYMGNANDAYGGTVAAGGGGGGYDGYGGTVSGGGDGTYYGGGGGYDASGGTWANGGYGGGTVESAYPAR